VSTIEECKECGGSSICELSFNEEEKISVAITSN